MAGSTDPTDDASSVTPPSGMLFKCWNTQADGSGDSYAPLANFTMPANDVTLYAIYIPAGTLYAVTYDMNGNTLDTAPGGMNLAAGQTFAATAYFSYFNYYTATGNVFKEWNTQADGQGTGYKVLATVVMPANNLTLYAIWGITQGFDSHAKRNGRAHQRQHRHHVRHGDGYLGKRGCVSRQ